MNSEKVNIVDFLQDFFNFEDDEACSHDAVEDYKAFAEISQRLLSLLTSSSNGQADSLDSKEKLAEQCLFEVGLLRRLNRLAQFRNKRKRDAVADVSRCHLLLAALS